MTTEQLESEAERIRDAINPGRKWTDLVWNIVFINALDTDKGRPMVEMEKGWIECINIARAVKPITMKAWATGQTLDWIERRTR